MDRYTLYYNSLRPTRPLEIDSEETLTSNDTTQHTVPTKPIAKLKTKNYDSTKKSDVKKKAREEDALDEIELKGLLDTEPNDEENTDEEHGDEGKKITIHVNCQPLTRFDIQVPEKRLVENLMKDIEQKVLLRVRKKITVLKLSIGESEVKKGLPPEFEIYGLLDDGEEVLVEFTTENLERNVKSLDDSSVSTQEDKPRLPLVCPFTFSSIKELKQHLANSRVKIQLSKKKLWKPNKKGEYSCPLTFYNQEDSSRHIQDGNRAKLELIEPDLRVFWERQDSSVQEKISRELIEKDQEEKMKKEQKEQKERDKKKKAKERQQSKKKEILDKENRLREIREQKEMQEKEMKEMKEKQKLQKKRASELKKDMKSLVLEIVSFAESLIERKLSESQKSHERSLSPGASKPKKKKKKSEKIQQDHSKKTTEPNPELKITPIVSEIASNQVQTPKLINGTHTSLTPNGHSQTANGKPHYSRTLSTLNQEIEAYLQQIKPMIDVQSSLTVSMTSKILQVARNIWENASLKIYGSFATSLAIPSSDLDIVVLGARTEGEQVINLFAKELKQQPWVKSLQVIETAKVPVIKVTSLEENIPTDISFDGTGMPAFATSDGLLVQHPGIASVEFINRFVAKFPEIRNLAILLKQLLYERSLNNAYTGGLSSYCLVVMIISFFQAQTASGNYNTNSKSTGVLLVEFLEYYGKKFDFSKYGIRVSHGGGLFSLEHSEHKFASLLVIIDPFNPANNISQNVTGFQKVKALFEEIHTALTSPFYLTFTPVVILERMLKKL